MIRAVVLLALLGGPAGAATLAECEALRERVPLDVSATDAVAGVCLFSDVRFGGGVPLRAARISLGGDIDALPDALPARLTGGVTGLALDREVPGQPGLAWLMREQTLPGMRLSFDMVSAEGVLRLNSLVFRADDRNEITVSARFAGVPEVWPVAPVAASAIRVQALEMEVAFDGMFESLLLLPLGTTLLDLTQEAEPQVAALRDVAAEFLAGFSGTAQAENAAQAQAFLDVLPHPRGVLEIDVGGAGIAAIQLLPALTGTVTPDYVTRVADAAALDVFWTPAE